MRTKLDIQIFYVLDRIRGEHGVTAEAWAKASGMHKPRIAELRKPGGPKGRAFTVEKLNDLLGGLGKLIGGDALRRGLKEAIEKTKDTKQRLLLYVLLLENEKTMKQAELYLKSAADMDEEK